MLILNICLKIRGASAVLHLLGGEAWALGAFFYFVIIEPSSKQPC
jgi:hypothetical protein